MSAAVRIKPATTSAKSVQDLVAKFGLRTVPAGAATPRRTEIPDDASPVSGAAEVAGASVVEAAGASATQSGEGASPEAATPGGEGATVSSVASDNRVVEPGDLFVALPGATTHGAAFASDAIQRGAAAILTDDAGAAHLAAQLDSAGQAAAGSQGGPPILIADDPRRLLGPVAEWVYGHPAKKLRTYAVTGTNGKTTTVFLLDHLLRALGYRSGLIGTVLMRSAERELPSKLTTPEADDLQAVFAAMVEDDVATLAMEVSSHSLVQRRVDPVVFDVAGFTNLTRDHLDFHQTIAEYFAAKAQLFTPEHARRGVVTIDDDWGRKLADIATIPVATLFTDTGDLRDYPDADWTVSDIVPAGTGSRFTLAHRDGRRLHTSISLPGDFNVANAALAATLVAESGIPLAEIDAALTATGGFSAQVPGRMEVITVASEGDMPDVGGGVGEQPRAPRVVVDFAHNTEAMELAMSALRGTTRGNLIIVFGATGERDQGKRAAMGQAAVEGADVVIVSDDDPHGEDPAPIRAQVLEGARAAAEVQLKEGRSVVIREISPRSAAIASAIEHASPADTVLIAGRGHETIQEVAGVDLHLDDRAEARDALTQWVRTATKGQS